ncbi:MAG: SCO1664 family protein [Chloroflexota bacterium]
MSEHDEIRDEQSSSQRVTVERLLEALQCGEIVEELGLMRWSSNYTFLVSIVHHDVKVMAIYKPQKGERPLWDFPDGTLCLRELAAFLTSHELGWNLVPPTVVRDGPRGFGSVQYYIEHDPEQNYFSFDESIRPQLQRLAAFDYVINNADRKGGHCLLDSEGQLWAIDHGIAFHSAPKLRTVIWDFAGQPVPEPLLDDLERLAAVLDDEKTPYRQALGRLLSPHEINTFRARVRHLLKTRRYPLPGAGPNYPWPPV